MSETSRYVQTHGRKKNAVAVALCKEGKGVLRVNGRPIDLLTPDTLRAKLMEPVLLLGLDRFRELDIRLRVRGGGYTSQVYALRVALSRAVVAYYQKFKEEWEKREIKEILLEYDRGLLVIDPRRCEPKKAGGRGARSKKQKSYR